MNSATAPELNARPEPPAPFHPTTPDEMNVTGFVHESLVPVRRSASHVAEMVTQLTFGDLVRVVDRAYGWYLIRNLDDGYQGWVPTTMVEPVSEAFIAPDQKFMLVRDLIAPIRVNRNGQQSVNHLVKGSRFPVFGFRHNASELLFKLGQIEFRIEVRHLTNPLPASPAAIAETAVTYLNVPYLWGGKSPFGADCSGFTQILFRLHGINLKRDSVQQATQGAAVAFEGRQAGHLAFFKNVHGVVSHVGYLLNRDTVIHGAGRVRMDKFTAEGIYNIDLRTLTHRLHSIRNML